MVVEELVFRIAPDQLDRWVGREAAVWDPFLEAQAGYLGKEVWQDLDDPASVRVIVRWASLDRWRAVPPDAVEAVEAAMGELVQRHEVRGQRVLRRAAASSAPGE